MREDSTISIRIKLKDAAEFAAETEAASIEIDGLGEAMARANRKSRKAETGFAKLEKRISKLGKVAKVATIITQGAAALSAASAAAYGLGSALAPLVGVLGAMPAAVLAGAQAYGVMRLALHGVREAVGGLDEKMNAQKFARLSAPAQQFALVLNHLKTPIRALQRTLQARMLPGFTAGLRAAEPALRALRPELAATAGGIGHFVSRLGHLVGSKGFLADLRSQMAFNNRQFKVMGGAGLHVVDAFRQLGVASRPLDASLVKMIGHWSQSADAMLRTGRQSGRLQAWFRGVAHLVREVVSIGGHFLGFLINVGHIARKELGEGLLADLDRGSESLDRWSKSAKGISETTGYFRQAKPTIEALGHVIRELGGDLTMLGGKGGLKMIELEAKALGAVAEAVGWIERKVPGGAAVITAFATAFLLFEKLKVLKIISGVSTAYKKFRDWYVAESAKTGAEAGAAEGESTATAGTGFKLIQKFLAPFRRFKAWLIGSSAEAGAEAGAAEGEAMASSDGLLSGGVLGKFKAAGGLLGKALGAAAAVWAGYELGESLGKLAVKGLEAVGVHESGGKENVKISEWWSHGSGEDGGAEVFGHGKKQIPTFGGLVKYAHIADKGQLLYIVHHHEYSLGQVERALRLAHRHLVLTNPSLHPVVVHQLAAHGVSMGATVRTVRAPTTTEVKRRGGATGGERPIHIHTHTTLKLDSKVVAQGTGEVVERKKGFE